MVIAKRSTAIGAFPSRSEAEIAVAAALEAGFLPDQVGIVLPDVLSLAADCELPGSTTLWAGSMFRKLIGVDVANEELRYYEEAIEEGRALVMIQAQDRYPEAMQIFDRCGGEYMQAF